MKQVVSLILIGMLILSGVSVFADTTDKVELVSSNPVPTLYDTVENNLFEVIQDGDFFTIILDENPSTGYLWSYKVSDENKVEFLNDEYISNEGNLIGAGGKREFSFKVKEEGVSTILFNNSRSWEKDSVIETVDVLVYKNNNELIIEENGVVSAVDTASPELYEDKAIEVFYNSEAVEYDVVPQVIDGITMIPLRATLEKMGYTVNWIEKTRTVEVLKSAQWTSLKIGENSYFKNKMAPVTLSMAPTIIEGRTLVPVEFFTLILDIILDRTFLVENNNINFIQE